MAVEEEPRLPLRLAVEAPLRHAFGREAAALALVDEGDKAPGGPVSLLLAEEGLVGVAAETLDAAKQALKDHAEEEGIPQLCLLRNPGTDLVWHLDGEPLPPEKEKGLRKLLQHHRNGRFKACSSAPFSKLVVEAIRRYYALQVREPSVRGFLSILEKQFPRSDLYLFELLQNAVDSGACWIAVEADPKGRGLRFRHDGQCFGPLDVLGLASVGLSTKAAASNIGFMGIGFKAVYKRFSRVTVHDGLFRFRFEEPKEVPAKESGVPSQGWVLQPRWVEDEAELWPEAVSDQDKDGATRSMVRFQLERPRGGMRSVLEDLARLPLTVLPLLARASRALQVPDVVDLADVVDLDDDDNEKAASAVDNFRLLWAGTEYSLKREFGTRSSFGKEGGLCEVLVCSKTDISRNQTKAPEEQRWVILSAPFTPGHLAKKAYERHTKRSYPDDRKEEVCLFFDEASPKKKGMLHATIPTSLQLPLGANLQAPWLLSVDRLVLQDVSENAWNLGLLEQLPNLLLLLLRWAAKSQLQRSSQDAHRLGQVLGMLPMIEEENGELKISCLGQRLSLKHLEETLQKQSLVPVWEDMHDGTVDASENGPTEAPLAKQQTSLAFTAGEDAAWLPPPFVELLPKGLLKRWLGAPCLTTNCLEHELQASPLWRKLKVQPTVATLQSRRDVLQNELRSLTTDAACSLCIRLMCALARTLESRTRGNVAGSIDKSKANQLLSFQFRAAVPLPGQHVPDITQWPVFLTGNMELAWPVEVLWPDAELATLPEEIKTPLMASSVQSLSSGQASTSGRKTRKQQLLHPRLHPLLLTPSITSATATPVDEFEVGARRCLKLALEASPMSALSLATAFQRRWEAWVTTSAEAALEEGQVTEVVRLTQWAMEHRRPDLVTHALTQECKLKLASSLALGKAFGSDFTAVQSLGGKSFEYLSERYLMGTGGKEASPAVRTRWATFFRDVCQVSVSFQVTCSQVKVGNKHDEWHKLTAADWSAFPSGKLPKLRNSQPSKVLALPYGIGCMDRLHCQVLDCGLSPEWAKVLQDLARCPDEERAAALWRLVAEVDVDVKMKPTEKDPLPACAATFRGQQSAHDSVNRTPNAVLERIQLTPADMKHGVPARRRLFFLPPGQPGCASLDLGWAHWVSQLSGIAMVPCRPQDKPTAPISWHQPSETLLEADPKRPGMPLAQLPSAICTSLARHPIREGLAWGSKKPELPLTRLKDILANSHRQLINEDVVNELCGIWRAVAAVSEAGELTPKEASVVRTLLASKGAVLPAQTGPVDGALLLPIRRCVDLHKGEVGSSSVGEALSSSLVRCGWLCDVRMDATFPLYDVVDILGKLLPTGKGFLAEPDEETLVEFFTWASYAQPQVQDMDPSFRDAFTQGLHCLMNRKRLPRLLPELRVFCRPGPGAPSSANRFPGCWRKVQKDWPRPLVDDDWNRLKSSFLRSDHGYQPLGLLDHREGPMKDMDAELHRALNFPRLSDNSKFLVKTKVGGAPLRMEDAEDRLLLVLQLFADEAGVSWSSLTEGPAILRHTSVCRVFEILGENFEPVSIPHYAILGKRDGFGTRRVILLSGDPEDYVCDLEECVERFLKEKKVFLEQHSRRTLRLLYAVENGDRFEKYLERDFGDSPCVRAFKKSEQRRQQERRKRKYDTEMRHRAGAGRGRGLTLPAWMTSTAIVLEPGLQPPQNSSPEPDRSWSATGANSIAVGQSAAEERFDLDQPLGKRRRKKDRFKGRSEMSDALWWTSTMEAGPQEREVVFGAVVAGLGERGCRFALETIRRAGVDLAGTQPEQLDAQQIDDFIQRCMAEAEATYQPEERTTTT